MRPKAPSAARVIPAASLAERGERTMAEGKWREAVECFKQLVKAEPAAGWEKKLAEAYRGRAGELAEKGMPKEAVILLENAFRLEADPETLGLYCDCLLRAGRTEPLGVLFFQQEENLSRHHPDFAARIRELVAILLLAGSLPERLLPAGSPWQSWLTLAREALAAFAAGEESLLESRLQALPLRSPFKALRLLLKALFLTRDDPRRARQLAESIPDASPWCGFARFVADTALDTTELLPRLPGLSPLERTVLAGARGCDPARLQRACERFALPDEQLLRTLVQPADREIAATETERRQLCFALLARQPTVGGFTLFEKRFGPLDAVEKHRLQALAAERNHSPDSPRHWQSCLSLLEAAPATPERNLHLALILRRLADQAHAPPPETPQHYLERSLEWDREDRNTHLRLLEIYREEGEERHYHRILEEALRRFPKDPAILHAAVKEALQRKSFKKASVLAKRLLELDPLHDGVRQDLTRAAIQQARKQVKAGRIDLARRELSQAAAFGRPGEKIGLIAICQGLIDDGPEGETLLLEGVRLVGDGVTGWFRAAAEGRAMGLPEARYTALTGRLRQVAREKPRSEEVLRLAGVATSYLSDKPVQLGSLLPVLEGWLRSALNLEFSLEEMRTLCLLLLDAGQFRLLTRWADKGTKRWPDQPIFPFCRIAAQHRNAPKSLIFNQVESLYSLLEEAYTIDDRETGKRIVNLLGPFGPGFSVPFDLEEEDDDDFDPHEWDGLPPFVPPPSIPRDLEASMVGELANLARELMQENPGKFDRNKMGQTLKAALIEGGGFTEREAHSEALAAILEKAMDRAGLPRRVASKTASGPNPPASSSATTPAKPQRRQNGRQRSFDF
ncbi:MAG: hypothetical protein HQL56_15315 [Magnetococcales bacterium]|nr:hypothetical protein [Magnetococcales bacterium]